MAVFLPHNTEDNDSHKNDRNSHHSHSFETERRLRLSFRLTSSFALYGKKQQVTDGKIKFYLLNLPITAELGIFLGHSLCEGTESSFSA